jgi:nucleoside-diphosphate-sugar epimerase
MKILITGASGFIGRLLCQHLSLSAEIAALSNLYYYSAIGANVSWSVADICDHEATESVLSSVRPDILIHCAGIAHQKIGNIGADEYYRVNSLATEHLAKASLSSNHDVHIIFLSSISVYGEKYSSGAVNEDNSCKPSSDYAESKLDAEIRLRRLHDSGRLKRLDILRLSPVYDSEWSLNLDRRVFAPKKGAYLRFGEGHQKMSAVSRQNVADFIEFLIRNSEGFGERYCNTYNVCDEQPYSFKTIIDTFRQSPYHPDRLVVPIPLSLIWGLTRMAGLV